MIISEGVILDVFGMEVNLVFGIMCDVVYIFVNGKFVGIILMICWFFFFNILLINLVILCSSMV